jgi:hypothetical protein
MPIGPEPKPSLAPSTGPGEYNPLKAINHALIGGLAAGGDLAMRTGGALLGAYQRGIAQAGESAGAPAFGRAMAGIPEAFPTGALVEGIIPHRGALSARITAEARSTQSPSRLAHRRYIPDAPRTDKPASVSRGSGNTAVGRARPQTSDRHGFGAAF